MISALLNSFKIPESRNDPYRLVLLRLLASVVISPTPGINGSALANCLDHNLFGGRSALWHHELFPARMSRITILPWDHAVYLLVRSACSCDGCGPCLGKAG
jgi:hypothetical protein